MWGMITALVSGALMSIQGVFNSAVMKQTSMWVSAGWVQISAFVVCLLMWLFTGRGAVSGLWQIEPRYMLTGGVMVFVWKYLVKPMGGVWGIYELLPAFILGCIAIVVVSLATAAPSEEILKEFDSVKEEK